MAIKRRIIVPNEKLLRRMARAADRLDNFRVTGPGVTFRKGEKAMALHISGGGGRVGGPQVVTDRLVWLTDHEAIATRSMAVGAESPALLVEVAWAYSAEEIELVLEEGDVLPYLRAKDGPLIWGEGEPEGFIYNLDELAPDGYSDTVVSGIDLVGPGYPRGTLPRPLTAAGNSNSARVKRPAVVRRHTLGEGSTRQFIWVIDKLLSHDGLC